MVDANSHDMSLGPRLARTLGLAAGCLALSLFSAEFMRLPSHVSMFWATNALAAGLILRWDAVLSPPLLPIFVWVIERRFILPEEDRLRRKFRMNFAQYCHKTRRWV